jgi:hypothetical protein
MRLHHTAIWAAAGALAFALPAGAQDEPTGGIYAKRFADAATKFAEADQGDDDPVQEPDEPAAVGDTAVREALNRAYIFLAASQHPDGSWASADSDRIAPLRAIGVTSLALLAFMEDGQTTETGAYKQVVRAGLEWLVTQQDRGSGLVGEQIGHTFLYDHAIATLALCEAHRRVPTAGYGSAAQRAVNLAQRARNPYGAWRYNLPPTGDNDTSVTGWMVLALTSAEQADLKVDGEAFEGALTWFSEVTDKTNGRTGYDSVGSASSRITGINDHFPPDGEGMTAVALYGRLLRGLSRRGPLMAMQADRLMKRQPEWDPAGLGTDMYYWYFGTRAMHALGGERWKAWRAALVQALVGSQANEGYWPAVGPWGLVGGRNYATALMASCLALDVHDAAPHESDLAQVEQPVILEAPISKQDKARSRAAVGRALTWLVANQAENGSWDIDGFPSSSQSDIGAPVHQVGVTGLALLALQGDGNTLRDGPYRAALTRGVKWLRDQQDRDTGLIGEDVGHSFLYDHAIATAALCEAYREEGTTQLKAPAQLAINYILRARNPYGAWRYEVPPVGDNDTSVTTWMVTALCTAKAAGLRIAPDALVGALNWVQEVTDPKTGRVGYDSVGSLSSRVVGLNDQFPPERGEAMTGAGMYVRQVLGQRPAQNPELDQGVKLLLLQLPEWSPGEFGCDLYYWMLASNAMHLRGGRDHTRWSKALRDALLPNQRADEDLAGSWDPVDPWSYAGGRIYATALATLALEADYRKPAGARGSSDD